MKWKLNLVVLMSFIMLLGGCVDSTNETDTNETDSSGYKVVHSSVSNSDKGIVTAGYVSSVSLKERAVFPKVGLVNNLLSVGADDSLSEVTFTVVDAVSGEESIQSVSILETMALSSKYVALRLADTRAGILNIATSEVYDISGIVFDEMQVKGEILRYLTNGKLVKVDLTDPLLIIQDVTNPDDVSSNSGSPTSIFSTVNTSDSPFKFFGFNQHGSSSQFTSPSYIVTLNDYIFALSGPSGGERILLFRENEQPYDCLDPAFVIVGGGTSGGVIQAVDGKLYQIVIIAEREAHIARYDFNADYPCWSQVIVTDLGVLPNLEASEWLGNSMKVDYKLTDVDRYVVFTKGFLKTSGTISGGITIEWGNLDLSALPLISNNLNNAIIIEGDYIYWLAADVIYRTHLINGGEGPIPFYTGTYIIKYDVVNGVVVVLEGGELKIISTPGGDAVASTLLADFDNAVSF